MIAQSTAQREKWLCPYPHDAAPLLPEIPSGTNGAVTGASLFGETCTDPNCLQPILRCAGCGGTNRTSARFCRYCGQKLAYEENFQDMLMRRDVAQHGTKKNYRQITLPGIMPGGVTAIVVGWGYFAFAAAQWGLGLMANAVLHPPRLLRRFRSSNDDLVTQLHAVSHPQWFPGFLALGRRSVFYLTLAPQPHCRCLFRLKERNWSIDGALISGSSVVLRLFDRAGNRLRWLAVAGDSRSVTPLPWQHRGPAGKMIKLAAEDEILYHTSEEVIRLNVRTGLETRYPAPPCGYDMAATPQMHPRTGEIFLLGGDDLIYRQNLANAVPFAFTDQPRPAAHLFFDPAEQALYLLSRQGLTALDDASGGEKWSFGRNADFSVLLGAQPPQRWGSHLIAAVRSPKWQGERISLLPLKPSGKMMPLPPAVAISPAPACTASGVIALQQPGATASSRHAALLQLNL
ncbi:hypothetical protein DCC62_09855 [candidate division KSB1 bacterium]|nr:MAG: hypothetical protein DCC62_09855 [candidate division KSB1 bacterium]